MFKKIQFLFVITLLMVFVGCQKKVSPLIVYQPTHKNYQWERSGIVYPPGAPRIDSGFLSNTATDGRRRIQIHQGIDIKGNHGQSILAVADGTVLEATVEKCWGPTIVVDHGNGKDGNKIVALYGHVGEILVAMGDQVKRGQLIARLANNQNEFDCIGGVRHLHFQIGRRYRHLINKGNFWGWAYFLEDGGEGRNPNLYWANGPNKVTCFEPNKIYKPGTLTYPVPCLNEQESLIIGATNYSGDYYGGKKDGIPHGKGTMIWSDGQEYKGEWINGELYGQGKLTDPDGNIFVGKYKFGKMDGQGREIYVRGERSGDRYEGEFWKGKRHGQGTKIWNDGRKFVGEWKEGKQWNGKKYDKNGNLNGKYLNGEWIKK